MSSQDVSVSTSPSTVVHQPIISSWVLAAVKENESFRESMKRPVAKMSVQIGGKMSFSHRNDINIVGLYDC